VSENFRKRLEKDWNEQNEQYKKWLAMQTQEAEQK
jgi:hypothetical protein